MQGSADGAETGAEAGGGRAGGRPALLARLAAAYGAAFDPSVLLSYTLLHVYSDLPWYLREVGAPAREALPALAEAWFGTAG
ncbi:hypothetical protein ACFV4X_11345 [Streptomyces ardesiacus]|uniref:hypothetical protein n=1 Tax=Streptomyces ardesiacus TaxID=285564 RepID=UPI00365D16C5